MSQNQARIVSLVPSWTETLLWGGLNVVGRTRFCLHPEDLVQGIPAVGGTKGFELEKVLQLNPDFVVMDQEENRKEMAEQLKAKGIELLVSQVTNMKTASSFLLDLSIKLNAEKLQNLANRYLAIQKLNPEKFLKNVILEGACSAADLKQMQYVIWKNPFMVIGKNTFVAEVLSLAGFYVFSEQKYPKIIAEDLKKSFCFFSSEPYPFRKDMLQLRHDGFKGVLVDAEKISWYGIRNLLFLESCL